jgi:soluble lytic murein transglycosylase-like protein
MVKQKLTLISDAAKKGWKRILVKGKKTWRNNGINSVLILDLDILNSPAVKSVLLVGILATTLSATMHEQAPAPVDSVKSSLVIVPPVEQDVVLANMAQQYVPKKAPKVVEKLKVRTTILKEAKVQVPEHVPDKHLALMLKEAKKNNVPIKIAIRLVQSESSFERTSRSHKGAKGYMQLMPATRKIYVDKLNIKDKSDAETNIIIGYAYLGDLFKLYKKRNISDKAAWRLTLASYNAGPGNVAKSGGVPNYCEKYITKIMGNQLL